MGNGITRNVFLPWEESPGCRGKLGQRSYALLVLSSWQVENSIITKSHSCTEQKKIVAFMDGQKKAHKGEQCTLKHCDLWNVGFFKEKNTQRMESGKGKQLAGWKIHTCYLEPVKPSRGMALLSDTVSLHPFMNPITHSLKHVALLITVLLLLIDSKPTFIFYSCSNTLL